MQRPPPEEQGVLASHQPRVPVLGREVPIMSGCENQRKLWLSETKGMWSPRRSSLGPALTDWRFELQSPGSSKGTRDVREGTEFSGFRERAGRATFSNLEGLAEAIVPLLSPPPAEPGDKCRIWVSIHLVITVHPALVIPWNLVPSNLWTHTIHFQWLLKYK